MRQAVRAGPLSVACRTELPRDHFVVPMQNPVGKVFLASRLARRKDQRRRRDRGEFNGDGPAEAANDA